MAKNKWGYVEVVLIKEVSFEWSHHRISSSHSKVKKAIHDSINQVNWLMRLIALPFYVFK